MKKTIFLILQKLHVPLAILAVGSFAMLSTLTSCEQKAVEPTGTPSITKVYMLDTVTRHKDSTFVKALPNSLIVISGQNLGGVQKVYFNDYEASFNTNYNTDTELIIRIPGDTPTAAINPKVSNKLRIVTSHGEINYDFAVIPPPPVIYYVYSEVVKVNSTINIYGQYFAGTSIAKLGKTSLEILNINKNGDVVTVKLPSVITTDTLYLESPGGIGKSLFKLNDLSDGILYDADKFDKCWGSPTVIAGTNPDAITGNFWTMTGKNVEPSWWMGDPFVAGFCANFNLKKGDPTQKVFKFEINIKAPLTLGTFNFELTQGGVTYAYGYQPHKKAADGKTFLDQTFANEGQKTNGWRTISIPLTDFTNGDGKKIDFADLTKFDSGTFYYRTNGDAPANLEELNLSIDNIRIVDAPIQLKK